LIAPNQRETIEVPLKKKSYPSNRGIALKIQLNKPFVVNGKEISYVNPDALTDSILNNWMKPKPFMEVVEFKIEGDSIRIDLEFRTARTRFNLSLKPIGENKFSVKPLGEIQY